MFARIKCVGSYTYLQLVRTQREGGRVRQRVLATLGRVAQLPGSGELEGLLRSVSQYSPQALAWVCGQTALSTRSWKLGPGLVFERLWQRLGLGESLNGLLAGRPFGFAVEQPERQRTKDPSPLAVKEVWVGAHRYVVCYNAGQARKDAQDRAAIVAALRQALQAGDKSLVGNQGYRRCLKGAGHHFEVDEAKLQSGARYDGLWVLRTHTALTPATVALRYKELWQVERRMRDTKSLARTRPICHKLDATIRGHVFCSFLALVLLREWDRCLEAAGVRAEGQDVLRDLKALADGTPRGAEAAVGALASARVLHPGVFQKVLRVASFSRWRWLL